MTKGIDYGTVMGKIDTGCATDYITVITQDLRMTKGIDYITVMGKIDTDYRIDYITVITKD